MAVTLEQAAAQLGVSNTPGADQLMAALRTHLGAAQACVDEVAPRAPEAVRDSAVYRLVRWLLDACPTAAERPEDGLRLSGAAPLLARWRTHGAAVID